jgi:hypothetical protein
MIAAVCRDLPFVLQMEKVVSDAARVCMMCAQHAGLEGELTPCIALHE